MASKTTKANRRAYGEGTIYFHTAHNQWSGQITLGDGKRKTCYGKTQAEVAAKLTVLRAERDALMAVAVCQLCGQPLPRIRRGRSSDTGR